MSDLFSSAGLVAFDSWPNVTVEPPNSGNELVVFGADALNCTPKLNFEVVSSDTDFALPNGAVVDVSELELMPGFSSSQHSHFLRWASFRVIHAEHSHLEFCFSTRLWNPESIFKLTAEIFDTFAEAPGLADSQATHFKASLLLRIKQVSHSHVLAAGLKPTNEESFEELSAGAAGAGFGLSQATHRSLLELFFSIQLSHSHWFVLGANIALSEGSGFSGASAALDNISAGLPRLSRTSKTLPVLS